MRRWGLVLAVVALGVFAGSARAALFGFNDGSIYDGVADDREAAVMAAAGTEVDRFTLNWQAVESVRGRYDFRLYDSIYRADLARGVRPLMILLFAPRWSWDRGARCPPDVLCRFPPAPRYLGALQRMVRVTLRRYPQLAGLEIWNEPNLSAFWAPRPDAARYVRMVRAAHAAARSAGSTVPVLAGSLANKAIPNGSGPDGVDPLRFLAAMYRRGAAGSYDGLSLHPYPGQIDLAATFRMLVGAEDLQARSGDRAPVWVTEVGVTTGGQVDALNQAGELVRLLSTLSAWPGVQAVLIHTLFPPPGQSGSEAGYAVVSPDGTPRPAYCALARERLRSPMSCVLSPLGSLRDRDQELRWDAQVQVGLAMRSAAEYARAHGGDLTGFTMPGGPLAPGQQPGSSADPAHVGVFRVGTATLLCNASRADVSYCAMFSRYGMTFGSARGSVGAAAGAAINDPQGSW